MTRLTLTTALAGCLALPATAETIGVSIPAATHGWAGALNFHAEQTVERREPGRESRRGGGVHLRS